MLSWDKERELREIRHLWILLFSGAIHCIFCIPSLKAKYGKRFLWLKCNLIYRQIDLLSNNNFVFIFICILFRPRIYNLEHKCTKMKVLPINSLYILLKHYWNIIGFWLFESRVRRDLIKRFYEVSICTRIFNFLVQ